MSTTTTFATAQQYQQQRQQQQKQLSRLCQAVLDGDSALVREYCELGDDVDEATGPLERTPLHLACRNNDLELASYLLEVAGARADPVSGDGLQALHIAVSHGNRRLVELLLLRQSTDGGGLSPPVKFMDRSPLYMAVDHDCYGIAEALLEAGARIDESRAGSCSLINLALRKGPEASRRWLALLTSYDCDGDDLDLVDAHELKTPLIRSIEEQDVALVSKLLSKGASPNLEAFSVEGYMSPLNLAAHLGNEELASLLLEHGARAGANEALRHAAMHGKLGLVEMLLGRAPVDPASVNLDGCTALHLAVINEQPETVRALLRHQNGAPSRSSNQQIPVLYCAVKTGRCDIVEMLLEHGYPVNEYVCQKITCLDYAIKTRSAAVIDTLMRHGAVFSSCSSLEKSFAVKNLALLRAQGGLKLGKEHRRRIAAHRELGRLFERCQRELEAMKLERIVQDDRTSTTTFYELLIANDDDQLLDMVRRCSASFPSDEECRERFPEYCDALLGNYERGRSRDELLGRAAEDFESTVVAPKLASSRSSSSIGSGGSSDCGGGEQRHRATIAAVRQIVSLLTDEDLRNLCSALGGRPPRQAAAEEETDEVDDPARYDDDQLHRKDFIMNRSDQSIAVA
ncbi:ankyrin-1-like [Trichogramma pretiosum]|uniref:ankyrin-1-like n=1 Tax=Trichogramma pretiosum TaxID=7493 RepID=UPI0006C9E3F7|nr:ankyrin-1-like [Trichogramma pretiosum]XP_023318916.1 ankyrin-1-like [Trichogramma pretiosum]